MRLETGDIIFNKFTGDIWESPMKMFEWLISTFTKSPYTHVAIVLNVGKDYTQVGESVSKGFTIWNSRGYYESKIDTGESAVMRFKGGLSPLIKKKVLGEALAIENIAYDWYDILDLIINILFKAKTRFGRKNMLICSEAVSRIYTLCGIYLVEDKYDDEVTPADLSRSDKLIKVEINE